MNYQVKYSHSFGMTDFALSIERVFDGGSYMDRCFVVSVRDDDNELRISCSSCQPSVEYAETYAEGISEAIKQAREFVETRNLKV